MNKFLYLRDDNSIPGIDPVPTDYIDYRVLAADTHESHTAPTGAEFVRITPVDADLYILIGDTAAVPSADVTDGSGSILVPDGVSRIFPMGAQTTVGLKSAGTPTVMLEFYG